MLLLPENNIPNTLWITPSIPEEISDIIQDLKLKRLMNLIVY